MQRPNIDIKSAEADLGKFASEDSCQPQFYNITQSNKPRVDEFSHDNDTVLENISGREKKGHE